MTKGLLVVLGILILWQYNHLNAQYVRREEFSSEKDRRTRYALDDWISYLESRHIHTIAVGHNYIYFATENGGILRYEMYQNYWDYPFTTSNGLASNRILDVAYDMTSSILWAVTDVDTCIFKPAEQEWLCRTEGSFWPYTFPDKPVPLNGSQIDKNVFYPAEFLDMLPHFFANGPWTIIENWHIMDENFDEYAINGFLLDKWERVWFPILDYGIGMGNLYAQRLDVIGLGLAHISPRAIRYQENDLWIGGEAMQGQGRPGIVNWRDKDGGWYVYQARWISSLPSNNVSDIEVTGDSVWFATDYGLSMYDRRRDTWKNYDQRQGMFSRTVIDLMIQGELLYIGTDKGINTYDLKSGIIKRIKDDAILLATIYQTGAQHDTIWAATNRGLFRRRSVEDGWEVVKIPTAISDVPTLAVQPFQNEIWFSSPEGVFWYDGTSKKWESFPQLGLEIPGPFYDLEVNEKSVWVSTQEGLLKYDRKLNYWRLFTVNDGLLDNLCFRLLLDGDYIWITTRSGISQFYWNSPERLD